MEQLQFKVSSALKDLVGKDLIVNDNVAIFELVKNAYDAYATKVEIEFLEDKITISDNGKGMTLEDLRDKWLFVGFSAKKDGTEDGDKQKSYRDTIKRHYAGAKGIGRFSCDRLGKDLILRTRSNASGILETIHVDWTNFEVDQHKEFENINIEHYSDNNGSVVFPENKHTGTILEITRLNDEKLPWTRRRLLELKHSLEKLINPFAETNDFSIEISCPRELSEDKRNIKEKKHEREIVNGILNNSITSILDIKTTQIDVRLTEEYIYTTLSDRGVEMYKICEKNKDFNKLTNVQINLYFLNRSAKNNFTRTMGIEPVNYGSVFLFRNGFRIMPFGNTGDDSWGLDYRAQQGKNRYLGTRDLFGRVDVVTDSIEEIKEVSSRDGGLIETQTSKQLLRFFEIAHRRLERYVSGVLWGGLFKQKKYFDSKEEAELKRKELQAIDKENDAPDYILKSSIGSKIDFIQLIKNLAKDKNVEVLSYNSDLANIFANIDDLGYIKPQFISDLERIAETTKDEVLITSIEDAKKRITELEREKKEAERKFKEEERKRQDAERKAKESEERRVEAERKRAEAAEAKRLAQIKAKEAELKRREEEIKRKEAEQKRKEEEEKRIEVEKELNKKKKQNLFLQSVDNLDKDRIIKYHHDIRLNSHTIQNSLEKLISLLNKGTVKISDMKRNVERIVRANKKIMSISMFASKANFNMNGEMLQADIVEFINQYVTSVLPEYYEDINCSCSTNGVKKILNFRPLEVNLAIDNFLSNSINADAKHFDITFTQFDDNIIEMCVCDDGRGLNNIPNNPSEIFEKGFSTTEGSGIGLYSIKSFVETELNGNIIVDTTYHSKYQDRGLKFIIKF